MSKTIILFDMDGTLTESRQSFDYKPLKEALCSLTNVGAEIGIITGSDEDYLREQMGNFLVNSSCRYRLHLLPCNGTKYFKPPEFSKDDFRLVHEVSMEEHLGSQNYRELIQELIYSQVDMATAGVPLTGHFINCRGSMINWSPIGRNANLEQRAEFMRIDKEEGLRERVIGELRSILELKDLMNKVTIKLGGDTSFDIYPTKWDKTYGLKHFNGWDVWFVGDRCGENGNDREIYEACTGQSYVTSGPENTEEIIECILKNLGRKNNG
jgi:HAD superfamily hydrolase (TIGR01484 family)